MTLANKNIFYFMMVLAMAGWGASWVNAKVLSSYINEYEMMFLRNFFTIITLAPILVITKKYFYSNTKSLILAFIAAIVMIVYLKFYFLGAQLFAFFKSFSRHPSFPMKNRDSLLSGLEK